MILDQRSHNAPPRTVRVRRIWIPYRKRGIVHLVILAAGLLITWALAVIVIVTISGAIFGSLVSEPDWFILPSLLMAVSAPIGWAMFLARRHHRATMKPTQERTRRLTKLASDERGGRRLPHRVLEREMRTFRYRGWMRETLRAIAPGELMVVNGPRILDEPRPVPCDLPFEPLDIAEESEQLWGLIAYNAEQQGLRIAFDGEADERVAAQDRRSEYRVQLHKWGRILLSVVWLTWVIRSCINSGWTYTSFIVCVAVLVIGGISLMTMILARRWWLVPGGLIWRRHHLWRWAMKVHLFTPENTPLVLNVKTHTGMVVCGDKAQSFTFHESAGWAIIAGWISTARRTTEQEALAFIGPDAVCA